MELSGLSIRPSFAGLPDEAEGALGGEGRGVEEVEAADAEGEGVLPFHEEVATLVVEGVMAFAVHFDAETGLGAVEVEGVGSDGDLPFESEAESIFAQALPEDALGGVHLATHPAGVVEGLGGVVAGVFAHGGF